MSGYRTIAGYGESEIIISKSRFIGRAYPVSDEDTVQQQLAAIKKQHWDASHNCHAYVLGKTGMVQRYSDDGEPQGTAGIPMLEVLKKRELTDTLVIVTRYFGGTLLGAGGLVRAYGKATSEAIDRAGIALMEPTVTLQLRCDYALWDKLQHALEHLPVMLGEIQYTESVLADVLVRTDDADGVIEQLNQQTNARIGITHGAVTDMAWPDK